MLDEFALQGMQRLAHGHALDRLDRLAFGLDSQHQAGAHQAPVDDDAAGAAVAGAATFLGAGEPQLVAQCLQQGLARFAKKFDLVAVDRRAYMIS